MIQMFPLKRHQWNFKFNPWHQRCRWSWLISGVATSLICMRASTYMLLSVFGSTSVAQQEIEACSQQSEGQNCSLSVAGGFIRHGFCQRIGPENHSMMACLSGSQSDPACQRGLFHTRSRACCASHCTSCHVLQVLTELGDLDPACSVEHILRLSSPCSQSLPPCVVARAFAGQIEFENNSSKQQAISEATLDSGNKESSVLFDLILPLIGGFAVSGCGITFLCCSLYRCMAGKTPPMPPTSPTSEACVRKQPKQSEQQKAKSKAISAKLKHPKHSKQDESRENQNEHQDDVVDDLPDTWLVWWWIWYGRMYLWNWGKLGNVKDEASELWRKKCSFNVPVKFSSGSLRRRNWRAPLTSQLTRLALQTFSRHNLTKQFSWLTCGHLGKPWAMRSQEIQGSYVFLPRRTICSTFQKRQYNISSVIAFQHITTTHVSIPTHSFPFPTCTDSEISKMGPWELFWLSAYTCT